MRKRNSRHVDGFWSSEDPVTAIAKSLARK